MQRTTLVLAAALAAGACGDEATGPARGLDADDRVSVALVTDALTGAIIFEQIALGGVRADAALSSAADVREFSRSRSCPAGGSIEADGQVERIVHGDGLVEFFVEGEGRQLDCAHERRGLTVTVNGEFTFSAERRRVNGQPTGPQTTTKAGHFSWTRSDGRSGECDFELTSVRNPDSMQRTVTGTICGRTVDRTVQWQHGT